MLLALSTEHAVASTRDCMGRDRLVDATVVNPIVTPSKTRWPTRRATRVSHETDAHGPYREEEYVDSEDEGGEEEGSEEEEEEEEGEEGGEDEEPAQSKADGKKEKPASGKKGFLRRIASHINRPSLDGLPAQSHLTKHFRLLQNPSPRSERRSSRRKSATTRNRSAKTTPKLKGPSLKTMMRRRRALITMR